MSLRHHTRGPNNWTPPRPTVAQQIRKRGPVLPMIGEPRSLFERLLGGWNG